MKVDRPPMWAIRFLQWFCRSDLLDAVLGDLLEIYGRRRKLIGKRRADWLFVWHVLRFLQPFAFKRKSKSNKLKFNTMIRHSIIISFRNFKRHKGQFIINLTGLFTSFTCVLFIFLWINDEKNVDKFHENSDRLFQIRSNHSDASGVFTWQEVPGLLLEEIESTVPQVRSVVATTETHDYTISVDDSYTRVNGKFASEDFFDVFTYPMLAGDGRHALLDKSGIIITEDLAMQLFNTTDAMGKKLTWHYWSKKKDVVVRGIMKNIPQNASDNFDFLMSWDFYHNELVQNRNWYNYYARIFTVLNDRDNKAPAEKQIDVILKENQQRENVDLFLVNYADQYLFGNYKNGFQAGGRIEYVHLFTIIAIFILFIACVNFINLSTAKATNRTKEIGVKKALGASRKSLIAQYFVESLLLCSLSFLLAILAVQLILPQFNLLTQKHLTLNFSAQLIYGSIFILSSVVILAGSYPALYLSGFNTLKVLKGKLSRKKGEVFGRKTLVIIQFTLSIILIVSVLVVGKQVEFVMNKNLGYNKENLLYFEREGKILENSESFINELKSIPGVGNAMASGFMVGGGASTGGVDWEGKTPEDQVQFWETDVGYDLIETMGMELVAGREFSEEFKADSVSVIFNETAIKAMGLEDPVGKTIRHYSGEKTIVGVVKDFNLISLHTPVEPMLFLFDPKSTHFIVTKLKNGNEVATIEKIHDLYKSFNPGYVFNYQFIDQDYQALYVTENRVNILSRYFASFAIIISCLGLFGLAAFTAESRFKEIGIRKILGSSAWGIVHLLSFDFTKMVIMAIAIAIPVSYIVCKNWLNDFAYHIDLNWWIFAGAGFIALVIAWITIGFQTMKAASANPTECLRNE